jgi:hypothetical protein
MLKHQWCFVVALYERRFGRFPAVIDRRYRTTQYFQGAFLRIGQRKVRIVKRIGLRIM